MRVGGGTDGYPEDVSEPAPPSAPRPPGTFRIGSLAGADVLVSSTWFVVAGLIAVLVAPRVEQVQPDLGALKYVAGVAFAVILYLSVLLHEASHAYMARHYGYRVTSITLHFLGGMTAIDSEARKARQEFWIAVVGPVTSLAVGGAALGLWFVTPDGLLLMAVEGLAGANLLVGALNLVPGLPLDGGRVLKAAVWGATGDQYRGAIVAGWTGRVVAALVLLWPTAQERLFGLEPQVIDYILALVIALFLWSGATASINAARVRRRFPALVARDLARRTLAVPGELPLAEAVRRAQDAEAGGIVTVTSAGAPVGVVNEAALLATPIDRRPWVATSAVARDLADGLRLPADISGEALVQALTRTPATEYLLVEPDGSIYGVLTTSDVDRAFRETGA
jgi:Zn-dependent protease